jgi:hypothetical protein
LDSSPLSVFAQVCLEIAHHDLPPFLHLSGNPKVFSEISNPEG